AVMRCAVECAVRPLNQAGIGVSAGRGIVEVLEDGEAGTVRVQLEHRADAAAAAGTRRAVERAVRTLNQPGRGGTAGGIVEVLEDGEAGAVRIELEERGGDAAAAASSRAVERAVRPLYQPGRGVTGSGVIIEVLEDGEAAPVRVQLEDRAVIAAAARTRRAVERAIRTLNQPGEATAGRGIVEVFEDGKA